MNRFGPRLAFRQVRRTFDYAGRATRTEVIAYWFFAMLAKFAIVAGVAFANQVPFLDTPRSIMLALGLAFGLPEVALFIRRLHDQGRTGWLALIGIPYAIINWIGPLPSQRPVWVELLNGAVSISILILLMLTPEVDRNRFGENPRLDLGK